MQNPQVCLYLCSVLSNQDLLNMEEKKKPEKRPNHTSRADINPETVDLSLNPQIQPPQITEPPKNSIPAKKSSFWAESKRTSAQNCLELILWLFLLWILGLNLGLIFTVFGGIAGIIAIFKG